VTKFLLRKKISALALVTLPFVTAFVTLPQVEYARSNFWSCGITSGKAMRSVCLQSVFATQPKPSLREKPILDSNVLSNQMFLIIFATREGSGSGLGRGV